MATVLEHAGHQIGHRAFKAYLEPYFHEHPIMSTIIIVAGLIIGGIIFLLARARKRSNQS